MRAGHRGQPRAGGLRQTTPRSTSARSPTCRPASTATDRPGLRQASAGPSCKPRRRHRGSGPDHRHDHPQPTHVGSLPRRGRSDPGPARHATLKLRAPAAGPIAGRTSVASPTSGSRWGQSCWPTRPGCLLPDLSSCGALVAISAPGARPSSRHRHAHPARSALTRVAQQHLLGHGGHVGAGLVEDVADGQAPATDEGLAAEVVEVPPVGAHAGGGTRWCGPGWPRRRPGGAPPRTRCPAGGPGPPRRWAGRRTGRPGRRRTGRAVGPGPR